MTSFAWRVARELEVAKECDVTWPPPADILLLGSVALAVIGVYVLPILAIQSGESASEALGLSMLLSLGCAFALAGQYDMLNQATKRSYDYCPLQDKVAIVARLCLAMVYLGFVLL